MKMFSLTSFSFNAPLVEVTSERLVPQTHAAVQACNYLIDYRGTLYHCWLLGFELAFFFTGKHGN